MSLQEVKVGWLLRKTSVLKRWKRNYFKLYNDGNVIYFKDSNLDERKGNFNVTRNCKKLTTALECEVDPPENCAYGCLLKLEGVDGSNLVLCGGSVDETLSWKLMIEQFVSSNPGSRNQNLPVCVPYKRGYACNNRQGYRVRSDIYYYPNYGPVQVSYDAWGRPYYHHPQNQVITVIQQEDPYYYRNGDMVYGLAAGAMLGWALWTPFLFF